MYADGQQNWQALTDSQTQGSGFTEVVARNAETYFGTVVGNDIYEAFATQANGQQRSSHREALTHATAASTVPYRVKLKDFHLDTHTLPSVHKPYIFVGSHHFGGHVLLSRD